MVTVITINDTTQTPYQKRGGHNGHWINDCANSALFGSVQHNTVAFGLAVVSHQVKVGTTRPTVNLSSVQFCSTANINLFHGRVPIVD